jgi:hypothetical protein
MCVCRKDIGWCHYIHTDMHRPKAGDDIAIETTRLPVASGMVDLYPTDRM